jgi:hypothetical protein
VIHITVGGGFFIRFSIGAVAFRINVVVLEEEAPGSIGSAETLS